MSDNARKRAAVTGLLLSALVCTAPAFALHWPAVHLPALHWPWQRRAAAQPQAVQEIAITSQTPIQQFWDRSTLLLDMTGVSGDGSATLAPAAGSAWPVRLEFRVRPGGMALLTVSGAQRLTFTVPAQGSSVVLKLDPGVYQFDTDQVTLRWSAADDLPH